jgi:hypothetical protein
MAVGRNSEHAEESAEVEVLLAQAKKHEELSKKIKASLGRVEDNGKRLEQLVSPVQHTLNGVRDLQAMVSSTLPFSRLLVTTADLS